MAAWADYDEALAWVEQAYKYALNQSNLALTNLNSAWTYWNAGNDHMAIYYALFTLSRLINGLRYSITCPVLLEEEFAVHYCLSNLPEAEPTEITMAGIILAMYSATTQELTDFIGIEDAYRQSLWNMPFNREYYAELARGFAEWE